MVIVVTLSGEGSLPAVSTPVLVLPVGWRHQGDGRATLGAPIYDAATRTGRRDYAWTLERVAPQAPAPEASLDTFDPKTGAYQHLTARP